MSDIKSHRKRYKTLKEYTDDEKVLSMADDIVFTQEELDALVDKMDSLGADDGKREIYLCGDFFILPAYLGDIIYRGVNNPDVIFDDVTVESGIDLQDLRFDMDKYIEEVCDYYVVPGEIIEECDRGEGMVSMYFVSFAHNTSLGRKILLQEAELGDADAQFAFGYVAYYDDTENEADMRECWREAGYSHNIMKEVTAEQHKWKEIGMQWWLKAAEQGNIDANVHLYYIRLNAGNLKSEEAKEAVKWFEKGVERECMFADFAIEGLGKCYMEGIGVEQTFEQAVQCLKQMVETENDEGIEKKVPPIAKYYLGYCYYYGKGIEQDYKKAVRMLQQAHDQDYGWATVLLGMCYQLGHGVKKSSEKAVEMYRKVAESVGVDANVGDALYLLACCYARGEGVEKSYEEAVRLLEEAIICSQYKRKCAKKLLEFCQQRL